MVNLPNFIYEKKPLRSGTTWLLTNRVVSDKTRSGRPKRRLGHSFDKRPFPVSFMLSYGEYAAFKTWWKNVCNSGLNSFMYGEIDGDGSVDKEYRFVAGKSPFFSNPSGKRIKVTMEWEEV